MSVSIVEHLYLSGRSEESESVNQELKSFLNALQPYLKERSSDEEDWYDGWNDLGDGKVSSESFLLLAARR